MNKISFIIEFDEVSKTQEEHLSEFIEKTGIKFQVLESDNDLKKYKKYKEVIDKAIEFIYAHSSMEPPYYEFREFYNVSNLSELLDILKEVE